MKFLILTVALFATSAFAQNPYEYVDDDLIQRVGQIIFEYDQKIAASRSSNNGGATSGSYNSNDNYNTRRVDNYAPAQQQQGYNRQQRHLTQQPQQQVYQNNQRYQRQYNAQPQVNSYQKPQVAAPYNYQRPQVPAQAAGPYKYEQPQVASQQPSTRNFGYILSQPEPMERIAEFHFTDGVAQGQGQQQQGNEGSIPTPVRRSENAQRGFRLA